MRWSWVCALLLALGMCVEAVAAAAPVAHVWVLPGGPEAGAITAVRDAQGWQQADDGALRRRDDARWWRVDIDADSARASGDWIISIREAYDAQLVAYAPPDYTPRPLATFDPEARQLGSRHRLTVEVPGDHLDDLRLAEVLRAGDRRHEADQDAVAHDLSLEPGRPVVVPDRLTAVGQVDPDPVLRDPGVRQLHVGEDVAGAQRLDHPASAFLIHTDDANQRCCAHAEGPLSGR